MTYKEAIQIQIRGLNIIRHHAAALREQATFEEKYAFNYLRDHTIPIIEHLEFIANMPDSFDRQLKGDYTIKINLTDI